MARFFQTSNPQNVDFAYEMPVNLMASAIQNADAQIDASVNNIGLLNQNLAKVQYLPADKEYATKAVSAYDEQASQIARQLMESPQNWRKQQPLISNLSRDIQKDLSSGGLGRVQGNLAAYQQYEKQLADQEKLFDGKGKGISPTTAQAFKQAALQKYNKAGGVNYQNGNYNSFSSYTEDPYPDVDLNTWTDEQLKNLKASGVIKEGTTAGQYLMKVGNEWKGVSPDKILGVLTNSFQADTDLQRNLAQKSKYGLVNPGTLNNPLMPYTLDNKGQVVWNEGNPIASAFRAGIAEHSYSETKNTQDINSNPLYNQQQNQAFEMKKMEAQEQADINKALRNSTLKVAEDIAKKQFPEGTVIPQDLKGYKNVEQIVNELGINAAMKTDLKMGDEIDYLPFGNNPDLTSVNLQIDGTKKVIEEINNGIKLNEGNPEILARLNQEKRTKEVQLYNARNINADSYNTVVNALPQKDKQFYDEMKSGGLTKSLQEIRVINANIEDMRAGGKPTSGFNLKEANERLRSIRADVVKYNNMEESILENRNKYVKDNYSRSTTRLATLVPSEPIKNLFFESLEGNKYGAKVIDPTTGKEVDVKMQTTGNEENIWSKLDRKNLKLSDVLDVQRVAGPANGVNASMVVRFKNTDVANVDPKKDYMLVMPDNVQAAVAGGLQKSGSTDKNVQTFIKDNFNSSRTYAASQLQDVKKQDLKVGEQGIPKRFEVMLPNPSGTRSATVTLEVTPMKTATGTQLVGEYIENGVKKPLPKLTESGEIINTNGIFVDESDILRSLYP